ncbi:Similar to S.cerevisiae protein YBT1 (Transporter of the ATP-binding cassette (ABC) family) [Malassezia sympodialis ATCC 42132]|uniref:Similar to S.cerevisiae protein YBT1 (Transporter of the ATP-binding cassette (ABC) family) n=1 Tax=Malassezia sympodialis (strain ATCC 42132) TaxID=1230383 RepID=A0A1M8AAE7_MALS4|nr:Similar to S.cerevisiae protein YBT1 (Transporter of the ATP-binding cassette (ABC) family) [Malassezia sympodialis ATCC 42132]
MEQWTPSGVINVCELWVFTVAVVLLGTRLHALRRLYLGTRRHSSLRRWIMQHVLGSPMAHPGSTIIRPEVVNEYAFWRQYKYARWFFLAVGGAGLLSNKLWNKDLQVLYIPFALQAAWLYHEHSHPKFALEVRWTCICTLFTVTACFFVGELFRFAFGEHFTPVLWVNVVLLGLLSGTIGLLPGIPRHVAVQGTAVKVALREDEPQEGSDADEAQSQSLEMAPTAPMSNSVLGALFFLHVGTLVRTVRRSGRLASRDVPLLGPNMQAETLSRHIHSLLHKPKWMRRRVVRPNAFESTPLLTAPGASNARHRGLRLVWVLMRANALHFGFLISLTLLAIGTYYAPAFFANRIFKALDESVGVDDTQVDTLYRCLPWVLGLFCTVIVSSTIQGALWSRMEGTLTVSLSSQLSMLLFNKTLRRRLGARAEADGKGDSQVLTLHLVDLGRITAVCFHLFAALTTPCELLLGGYFAYRVLGISALVGLGTTVVLMPLIGSLSRAYSRANERLMSVRDRRMGLLNECFFGIRMIKAQAWEPMFDGKINHTRTDEIRELRWSFVFESLLSVVLELNPLLVTLVAFTFYTQVLHETLTPQVAFTSLAVFNELRWTIIMLPRAVTSFAQTLVSAGRMAEYLDSPEVSPPARTLRASPASPATVRLDKATVAWPLTGQGSSFVLRNISVEFPVGRTLLCGRVGCGKTLLLHALLHEAEVLHGTVQCPRSPSISVPAEAESLTEAQRALGTDAWLHPDMVAYAPQQPFLMNTTIRDNILFGLPLGNATRYQAVLKACALTNDLEQWEHGDLTIVGENGTELSGGQKARIGLARAVYSRATVVLLDDVLSAVDTGTARYLTTHLLAGPLLDQRIVLLVSHNVAQVGQVVDQVVYMEPGRVAFHGTPSAFFESPHYSGWQTAEKEERNEPASEPHEPPLSTTEAKRVLEHRETGSIAWKVWSAYVAASSGWSLCLLTMLLFALANLWDLVTNAWVRDWSASGGRGHSSAWWLERYAGLVLVGVVFGVLRWVGIYTMSLRASRTLFGRMLWRTMHAPMRFFDRTTRGRLLNRFGQDMEVIDATFARAIADVVIRVTQLLATSIALYMVGGILFVLVLLALLPLYGWVACRYMGVARDLQRLTSTSRSLVVHAFSHTVQGVQVIRAFGAQERFTDDMLGLLDNYNRFVWWTAQGSRWLSQMFNLISSMLVLISCVLVLLAPHTEPASVDFSLTFLIDLNFVLLILMRMYTALQTSAVSVERVFEFAASIEQEPEAPQALVPSAAWPEHGHIQVENLRLRYAPDRPDVLKGVSFEVPRASKLAIVGPTGSGKSTLMSAFLRFLEPAAGRIVMDGCDIGELALHDLRSRLQIVPQDPVILSGPLRSVLDVAGEFDDAQLLESLRAVHLITDDSMAMEDLSMPIAENGANLSQGQRQLLCLARALLRKSRVVLFDEASSSIDYTTDLQITEVIQEAFRDSTVITIAHRLRSVIAYDRVLYLEDGQVAEWGEPAELLRNPKSKFYTLCQHAGAPEFQALVQAAEDAALRRRS